ncbi:MAG TPA: tetraacyldisaccharide 4'-kinase [Cytophagaceae bacterium]|jgi:tetraacyldisaccharide 4'-kinase|nr:tetraacyldisaccharide 4'-kinase [Cytophagaceae bacterium]
MLLYPFSMLYGIVMVVRNACYNWGVFKEKGTPVFSIGIGNITVGGTGKTPHIEYLIQQFLEYHQIATLSRGYGRKTRGFLSVNAKMGPQLTGDEPWQFFLKFGSNVHVNVGEKRALAALKIHELYPGVNLLLMDDVYQHRAVKPDFSILLCDYHRPFFLDYPFPAGRLREFRSAAQRADIIIVSKCLSTITTSEKQLFERQLQRYASDVPVAFSTFRYGEVIPVFNSSVPSKWLLVTGIANAEPLVKYLEKEKQLVHHLEYGDHHDFSTTEAQEILKAYHDLADESVGILLTEKDHARLTEEIRQLWKTVPLFYIPISVTFLEGEQILLQNIRQAMSRRAGFPIK